MYAAIGNVYARSSKQLSKSAIMMPFRVIRLAGMVVIAVVLTGRCLLLYTRCLQCTLCMIRPCCKSWVLC